MNVIGPSVFMKVRVHFSGGRKDIFLFGSLNYIKHKWGSVVHFRTVWARAGGEVRFSQEKGNFGTHLVSVWWSSVCFELESQPLCPGLALAGVAGKEGTEPREVNSPPKRAASALKLPPVSQQLKQPACSHRWKSFYTSLQVLLPCLLVSFMSCLLLK